MNESLNTIVARLTAFAQERGAVLQPKGQVGIGRPCVGICADGKYIDHNPFRFPNYEPIQELADTRLDAPEGVRAYHKHDCLAVLVEGDDYETALRGLARWVDHLCSLGRVEFVRYDTGARGAQALFTGTHSMAVRIAPPAPAAVPA